MQNLKHEQIIFLDLDKKKNLVLTYILQELGIEKINSYSIHENFYKIFPIIQSSSVIFINLSCSGVEIFLQRLRFKKISDGFAPTLIGYTENGNLVKDKVESLMISSFLKSPIYMIDVYEQLKFSLDFKCFKQNNLKIKKSNSADQTKEKYLIGGQYQRSMVLL